MYFVLLRCGLFRPTPWALIPGTFPMKQTLLTDDSFQVDEGRCRVPSELSSPWVKHLPSTLAVVMPLISPSLCPQVLSTV